VKVAEVKLALAAMKCSRLRFFLF